MAKKERLRRDHAGIGPEPGRAGLQPLKKTKGFRIAKGEPDIRGWEVHTLNGRRVGQVDDLLVDVDAGDVVMLDVEMRGSQRHLELPIRSAQLDRDQRRVIVDSGDVDRYGGSAEDLDADGVADRHERDIAARDLDRDGLDDRDEIRARDESRSRDEIRTRDEIRSRDDPRLTRTATRLERDESAADARADGDEIVVERRPVVEEVVVRRRVVDQDE